ncbi:hypothetical protein QAD02_014336 [Eretmocerus hayati]|uniref:Uncharacterized protein n=1 Tax=Eretmocerus hayati TaxID=131215 RepID=A0ACC2P4M3_9HYME|nr:hypothetical protein QAD02_014336 [Eretmocerus hayati]
MVCACATLAPLAACGTDRRWRDPRRLPGAAGSAPPPPPTTSPRPSTCWSCPRRCLLHHRAREGSMGCRIWRRRCSPCEMNEIETGRRNFLVRSARTSRCIKYYNVLGENFGTRKQCDPRISSARAESQ